MVGGYIPVAAARFKHSLLNKPKRVAFLCYNDRVPVQRCIGVNIPIDCHVWESRWAVGVPAHQHPTSRGMPPQEVM